MRLYLSILILIPFLTKGQSHANDTIKKDTLLIVKENSTKGFHNEYILFIPQGTKKNRLTHLLVEPNNTGRTSNDMNVHKTQAIALASKSSVGNNIATVLKIPLLVPVFPRPEAKPLVYTHALDRDVIFEDSKPLKRLDLQLIAMIKDARDVLNDMEIPVHDKIFMNGFSASATFTNRFLFIHPELIEAAAMGGFNGKLMLPLEIYKEEALPYPIGLFDFKKIFGKDFNKTKFDSIPQYIYMGALDENDAVLFEDAYSISEKNLINSLLADRVQERFKVCQHLYTEHHVNAVFSTYEDVGHETTSHMNLDVILFFFKQIEKYKE